MANINACLTSKTDEHYTPLSFLIKVYEFYGGTLDLDPCCNDLASPTVFANAHYDAALDGLALPWFGKVFVNPPYGRSLLSWANKIAQEFECGNTTESLFLVPSRTDTKWTRRLSDYSRCYLEKRIKFVSEDGQEQDSAPFPSVLFYFGKRQTEFKQYWEQHGQVWLVQNKTSNFDRTAYQREYMRKRRAISKQQDKKD